MIKKDSIIYRSRQGYAYQDKYALLKFLQYLKEGRLVEFYVDFPFGNRDSLDIVSVLNIEGQEGEQEKHIFEIKTGQKFKETKNSIAIELQALYSFKKKDKLVSKVFLIVDPNLESNFHQIRTELLQIRQRNGGTIGVEKYADFISRCYEQHGSAFASKSEFKIFIAKELHFDQNNNFNNTKGIKNEEHTPLENQIIAKIRCICNEKVFFRDNLYSPWIMAQELLEIIKQSAGNGKSLKNDLMDCFLRSSTRINILDKYFKLEDGTSLSKAIKESRDELEKMFEESKVGSRRINKENNYSPGPEGAVIDQLSDVVEF